MRLQIFSDLHADVSPPKHIEVAPRVDLMSAAYVSDLSAVIEAGRPAVWIYGHVHESFDYCVGGTRMLCNPHGYCSENPSFDPSLVVEIGS